jgi:hypothetical protein
MSFIQDISDSVTLEFESEKYDVVLRKFLLFFEQNIQTAK